jgi:hypothetical protein
MELWRQALTNPDEVNPVVLPQLADVVVRALAVGAKPPLTYLGAGMTAIVLCDSRAQEHAFKAYRFPDPRTFEGHEREAEWLQVASADRDLRDVVARFFAWHPVEQVLERECLTGRPGGWGTRGIRDLYERIQAVMWKHGWTAPEYKEDSFVVEAQTQRLVLVDAGFAHRRRETLVAYVREALDGKRAHHESWRDLAFYLRLEMMDGDISEAAGRPLHDELEARAGERLGL